MERNGRTAALIVWAGWLLVAIFLRVGPASALSSTQNTLQAGVGAVLTLLPSDWFETTLPDQSQQIEQLQAENRELIRLAAELKAERDQLQLHQQLPVNSDQALLNSTLTTARILGRKGDPASTNLELLISLGKRSGLNEADLVLTGEGLLIDAGRNQQLKPDQIITAGRTLLGRTRRVGEQTAIVQPLIDADFRIAVRVIRRSPLGPVQGPAGVLAGTGTGCRINEVSATAAIAVGDDVYTDPTASPTGVPVYCGRISQAEAEPAANHWTIQMVPVNSLKELPAHVEVLISSINKRGDEATMTSPPQ
ncbi:rod shape-determining protein MreC [Planctomicrobium sp. SH527]|uniref:rod shape-determining protein MreC n=1 Tax=Planctomicrobium sp. SH527 TaxID=3448123 RepID=UPI003F5C635D